MDPCSFVRILIGDLALKLPVASKPSFSGTVHPSASPCFCKIKLKNFPHQFAAISLNRDANSRSLAACFSLDKAQFERLAAKPQCLKIKVYTGRRGSTCGLNASKLLGKVSVPLDLRVAESRPYVFQNGWVSIGEKDNKESSNLSSSQLRLCVRAEPDPRFVFQFDGEPECSPQVFQVQGSVKQPVFTCKFGFRSSSDLKNRFVRVPLLLLLYFFFLFCIQLAKKFELSRLVD